MASERDTIASERDMRHMSFIEIDKNDMYNY